MGLELAAVLPGEKVIDREPAGAVNKNQCEQKEDERGKLEVLPLLDEQHLGQPDIEDRAEKYRNLPDIQVLSD